MTSSSSPGMSLKGEGISYMAGADLPGVIINVQRGGPGLGGIQPSQSDYWQATRAMGHGDFQVLVCSFHRPGDGRSGVRPSTKADKYRMPAMILADGMLGQMMEPSWSCPSAWSSCRRSLGPPPVISASATTTSWTRST